MLDEEESCKKECKELSSLLLTDIQRIYGEITPEIAKPLIIKNKWLAEISSRVSRLMQDVTQAITSDVSALVKRYEHTLEELNEAFHSQEVAVRAHLKEMGFDL